MLTHSVKVYSLSFRHMIINTMVAAKNAEAIPVRRSLPATLSCRKSLENRNANKTTKRVAGSDLRTGIDVYKRQGLCGAVRAAGAQAYPCAVSPFYQ